MSASCPVTVSPMVRILRAVVALIFLGMGLEYLHQPFLAIILFVAAVVVGSSVFTRSCVGIFARFLEPKSDA